MSVDQEVLQDVSNSKEVDVFVRSLYDDVAGPLLSFVLRLTRNPVLAEEVVQEAVVRAWRRAGDLDIGSDGLRKWLYTVARNLVTDVWRSEATRPVTVSHESLLRTASAGDDVERATQRLAVSDALDTLTPKHRDVLIAIYYEGCSVNEAARHFGVPPGTVKSRAHHALRALRLVLNGPAAA
jgi:RNA polymerase sigma-70 factor (ECF subfamily)